MLVSFFLSLPVPMFTSKNDVFSLSHCSYFPVTSSTQEAATRDLSLHTEAESLVVRLGSGRFGDDVTSV